VAKLASADIDLAAVKTQIKAAVAADQATVGGDTQLAQQFLRVFNQRLDEVEDYDQLPFELLKQIPGLEEVTQRTPVFMQRSLGLNCQDNCNVPVSLAGIWGYGCWCNFGADLMEGNGAPVNGHDTICQRMQQCLRCAKIDGASEGNSCDPKTKSYTAEFTMNPNMSLDAACESQNGDDFCAIRVCTCEMKLVADLVDYIFTGQGYDPNFRHPEIGGDFDQGKECPTHSKPGSPSNTVCCGGYPSRVPYSTNGSKDCCNNREVYSVVHQQCCDDGVFALGATC